MSAKEDPLVVARRIYDDLFATKRTPGGEPFAVPRNGGRPVALTPKGEGAALGVLRAAALNEKVPRSALVEALTQAYDTAAPLGVPTAELHLRSARPEPGMIVVDLGEADSTRCVVVTAKGWKVKAKPPRGVHFRLSRASRPLPAPKRGDGHRELRILLGWKKGDRRWLIVRGWLAAALIPDIARPLLYLTGRQGSGKSTRGVLIASVIDPRTELGGALAKSEIDALVAASARFVPAWDNITNVSLETSNFLCRLVTGAVDERRSLFTDDDLHLRTLRRTGVLTGLTLPLLEPDALHRILPIGCDALAERERTSEQSLRAAFEAAHPAILAAVLDDLAAVLAALPAVQSERRDRPRMTDFSDALYALDPRLDTAFQGAAEELVRETAQDDPFVRAVVTWLELRGSQGHLPLHLTQRAALEDLRSVTLAARGLDGHGWLPAREDALTRALTRAAAQLEVLGFAADRGRHTKTGRLWVYRSVDHVPAPSPIDAKRKKA